jgi:hypothetical protein
MTTRRPQPGDPDWHRAYQFPVTKAPVPPRGLSPGRMSLRRQRDFMSYKRGTGATDRKP